MIRLRRHREGDLGPGMFKSKVTAKTDVTPEQATSVPGQSRGVRRGSLMRDWSKNVDFTMNCISFVTPSSHFVMMVIKRRSFASIARFQSRWVYIIPRHLESDTLSTSVTTPKPWVRFSSTKLVEYLKRGQVHELADLCVPRAHGRLVSNTTACRPSVSVTGNSLKNPAEEGHLELTRALTTYRTVDVPGRVPSTGESHLSVTVIILFSLPTRLSRLRSLQLD